MKNKLESILEVTMPVGNNGISDHECSDGGAHEIESSTYVDQCSKCSYEYIYPSILTARPGSRNGYEDYLSERIKAEES